MRSVTIEKVENGFIINTEENKAYVAIDFYNIRTTLEEIFKEESKEVSSEF